MYCLLESLAASLNPHNDHWRLRDEAANILARISRYGLLLLYSLCYPVKWSWLLSRACIRCWCVLQCWIWSCYPLQRITIVKEVFQFVFKTFIDHWRLRDEAANILARISRYGLLLLYSLCYPVKWSWLLSRACIRCWCVLQCWIWSCYPLQRITIVKEVFQFVFKTFIDRVCLIVLPVAVWLACLLTAMLYSATV